MELTRDRIALESHMLASVSQQTRASELSNELCICRDSEPTLALRLMGSLKIMGPLLAVLAFLLPFQSAGQSVATQQRRDGSAQKVLRPSAQGQCWVESVQKQSVPTEQSVGPFLEALKYLSMPHSKSLGESDDDRDDFSEFSDSAPRFSGDHDVNICVPRDRTRPGVIQFGGIRCAVKAMGAHRDRAQRKGDTPTGVFRVKSVGGNSKGLWGGEGLQLTATWSGTTTPDGDPGRGTPPTSDMYIHSLNGLESDSQLGRVSSWGCPIVPQACMGMLRDYFRKKGGSDFTVNIRDQGAGC